MQVRSVAETPLSHPPEGGRSFGHVRGHADARNTAPTIEESFDPTDDALSVPTGPEPVVTVDEDAVDRCRIDRR